MPDFFFNRQCKWGDLDDSSKLEEASNQDNLEKAVWPCGCDPLPPSG